VSEPRTGARVAVIVLAVIPAAVFWLVIAAFIASASFAWLDAIWLGVPVLFIGSAVVSGVRRARTAPRKQDTP
jgi:hypothetical protein